MQGIRLLTIVALTLFFFLGNALAQKRGRGGRETGKRIKEMTLVISDVTLSSSGGGGGAISYQVERRGRLRTSYIGIAGVTRIQKQGKDITIKDLKKTDKVAVTLYQDPEDPHFPALAVKVIGKGELKKPRRGRRKKRS